MSFGIITSRKLFCANSYTNSIEEKLLNVVMATKFFLDTNSLNALTGLDKAGFSLLRTRLEESNAELCVTHIQVDERYTKEPSDYQQKIDKALEVLERNGIEIRKTMRTLTTKGLVIGISRVGFSMIFDAKIDDELRREIKKCDDEREKHKNMDKEARKLNIARDSLIAISSLDHDYFITSDKCLFQSWLKLVEGNAENRGILEKSHKIPKIIYVEPFPQAVLKEILTRT